MRLRGPGGKKFWEPSRKQVEQKKTEEQKKETQTDELVPGATEASAETETESEAQEETSEESKASEIPTAEELSGSYSFTGTNYYLQKDNFDMGTFEFADLGNGNLRCTDTAWGDIMEGIYDPSTGTAAFSSVLDMHLSFVKTEDGGITAHMRVLKSGDAYGDFTATKA